MENKTLVPISTKLLEELFEGFSVDAELVARKIGTKRHIVEAWLKGEKHPTYQQAEKLAYSVFKIPLAILFLDMLPDTFNPKTKFRSLPDLLFSDVSYKTRLAINKASTFISALKDIYVKNEGLPKLNSLFQNSTQINSDIAKKLREEFKLDELLKKTKPRADAFYLSVRRMLEEYGVFTFHAQLEGVRAFCINDSEFPIIIINSADAPTAKLFSLFHELAHIIIKSDDVFFEEFEKYQSKEEVFCNAVAAEVLLPAKRVIEFFTHNETDDDTIVSYASSMCVSREVVYRKLLNLGKITQSRYLSFRASQSVISSTVDNEKKVVIDYYTVRLSRLGRRYVSRVLELLNSGYLAEKTASGYLDIKSSQLIKLETELYA